MPEYRTPLPGILAAVLEGGLNRILALDEGSPERLKHLSGRVLQLDIEGIGITLFFSFTERRVSVGTNSTAEPDTVISGSPTALFTMAVPDDAPGWGIGDSRVNISGDANLARDLERLFSKLDPDWESSLSRIFGDVWGYQAAAGLRSGARQAREAAGSAGDMLNEFIESGQGPVLQSTDFSEFSHSVDELKATAGRIENLLDRLEATKE